MVIMAEATRFVLPPFFYFKPGHYRNPFANRKRGI